MRTSRTRAPAYQLSPNIVSNSDDFDYTDIKIYPKLLQSTNARFPKTPDVANKYKMKFGLCGNFFDSEEILPVVSHEDDKGYRCAQCRSYINCYCPIHNDGSNWSCSVCGQSNYLPRKLHGFPGSDSRLPNWKDHPEFSGNAYDVYCSKKDSKAPLPNSFVFVIEATNLAIRSGYLTAVCKAVKEFITKWKDVPRTKVSFVFFDTRISYLKIVDNSVSFTICSDVNEPVAPRSFGYKIDLDDSFELLCEILDFLPENFDLDNYAATNESVFGAAINAASSLYVSTGATLMCYIRTIPNRGKGSLMVSSRITGATNQKNYINDLLSEIKRDVPFANKVTFWKDLAFDMLAKNFTCHVFAAPSAQIEIAEIAACARYTNGTLNTILDFDPICHTSKIIDDTFRAAPISRVSSVGSKLRTRNEVSLTRFHFMGAVTEIDRAHSPYFDDRSSISYELSVLHAIPTNHIVCQAVLSYQDVNNENYLRVATIRIPVTESIYDVAVTIDPDVAPSFLAKTMASAMVLDSSWQGSIDSMKEQLTAWLKAARITDLYSSQIAPSAQMFMQNMFSMMEMPMNAPVNSDNDDQTRITNICSILKYPPSILKNLIRHRMIDVTDLNNVAYCPLNESALSGSMYILETDYEFILYIFKERMEDEQIKDFFIDSGNGFLSINTNSARYVAISAYIEMLAQERKTFLPIKVMFQGDAYKRTMNFLLNERPEKFVSFWGQLK